jgi:protein gp37
VQVQTSRLDWVICGPETGPGKRPFESKWAALLRNQCVAAGVAYFDKRDSHAGWREFPREAPWRGVAP